MDLLSYALVSLADTKSFLGITNDSKNELLKLLINQATDYIEQATNRRFVSTVYTNEKFDGTGKRDAVLKHFPIISFTQLQENRATDNSDDWETIDSSKYWVDLDSGLITMTSSFMDFDDNDEEGLSAGNMFKLGKNKYRATYTAGYSTIVPYDIQYACMVFVSEALNAGKSAGITEERLGDHSIRFEATSQENKKIKSILDKYRDINI